MIGSLNDLDEGEIKLNEKRLKNEEVKERGN